MSDIESLFIAIIIAFGLFLYTEPAHSATPAERAVAQTTSPPRASFRGTSWGMTPADVRAIEGRGWIVMSARGVSQRFACKKKIAGHACSYYFGFRHGRLRFASYHMDEPFGARHADYLARWQAIQGALTARYGAPGEVKVLWHSAALSRGKGQPDGMAVVTGDAEHVATWAVGDTVIIHRMRAEGIGNVIHSITYMSVAGVGEAQRVQEHETWHML